MQMREDDQTFFRTIDQFAVIISFPWAAQKVAFMGDNNIAIIVVSYELTCIDPAVCAPSNFSISGNQGFPPLRIARWFVPMTSYVWYRYFISYDNCLKVPRLFQRFAKRWVTKSLYYPGTFSAQIYFSCFLTVHKSFSKYYHCRDYYYCIISIAVSISKYYYCYSVSIINEQL